MLLGKLRRSIALVLISARPFQVNLDRGTPGIMSSNPPPLARSTPITIKLQSQSNPNQPLIHDYIDNMLMRELSTAQVEATDNEAFLVKLFPDECLPEPLDVTFEALSTGDTPIIKLDGDPDHTWLFVNKGITTYDKPETNEEQVASFMESIAKAAYSTYKKKPKIFRKWTGRFSTVPLKTDVIDIQRKPDVIGVTDTEALNIALKSNPPRLGWPFVDFILEHKENEVNFIAKVLKDLLNKGFCVLHTQDDRRFVIILTLSRTIMRFTVCDRGGVIHSSEFDIHRKPKLLLRLVLGLTFADGVFLGRDPTIRMGKNKERYVTVNGKSYRIIKTIWRSPMISGRATKCFLCKHRGKTYVIKDSWVVATRLPSEIFFLNEAAEAGVKNIPKLVDYEDVVIDEVLDSTEVNRGRFTNLSCRVHRRLVFEGFAEPIWTFENNIELISAFIDYIEAHEELLTRASILHRDISLCNLMLMMVNTLAEDGITMIQVRKGILVDFDYAKDEDEERAQGLKEPSSSRNKLRSSPRLNDKTEETEMDRGHRTGTPPFMANQILRLPDTKHTAAHDLESFFYVLLYICTMLFGPNSGQKANNLPHFIQSWMYSTDLRNVGLNKRGIVTMPMAEFDETILCDVTPYFNDLKPCLMKLQQLFHEFETKPPTHQDFLAVLKQTLQDLKDRQASTGPTAPTAPVDPTAPTGPTGPVDPTAPVTATEPVAPASVMPLGQDIVIPDLIDAEEAYRRNELRKLDQKGKAALIVSADPFLEPHTATTEPAYVLGAPRPVPKRATQDIHIEHEDDAASPHKALINADGKRIPALPKMETEFPSPPPSPTPFTNSYKKVSGDGDRHAEGSVPSPPSHLPSSSYVDVGRNINQDADQEVNVLQEELSNLKVVDNVEVRSESRTRPSRARTRAATNPKVIKETSDTGGSQIADNDTPLSEAMAPKSATSLAPTVTSETRTTRSASKLRVLQEQAEPKGSADGRSRRRDASKSRSNAEMSSAEASAVGRSKKAPIKKSTSKGPTPRTTSNSKKALESDNLN